jgi:uncharacterized membrane protein
MPQTEQEFVRILKDRLEDTLPPGELSDIISDYTEHFRMGKAEGRSEEELFCSLGSPEDVSREIRAAHLVKKAEDVTSCRNILHAVLATIGLGLFNLVFVLFPFIILVLLLLVVFIVGIAFVVCGPVAGVFALLQLAGIPAFAIWLSPAAGIFFSTGITTLGLLLVIGDYFLARFFYRIGIRYLKWNIGVITGTETLA